MRRRAVMRRGGWSLVDQALSSGSNFLLSIAVARAVGVREFGVFALVYGAFVFLLAVTRMYGGFPLIIHYSREAGIDRRVIGSAVAISVGLGGVLGVAGAALALVLTGSAAATTLAMSLSLAGLLGQDTLRYSFFARRRPEQAAANDALFLLVQVSLFAVAPAIGPAHTAWLFVAMWGIAAYAALAAGLVWSRAQLRLSVAREYLATHWRSSAHFSLEAALNAALIQGFPYIVAIGVGLEGAAAVRAAFVVLGPFYVFLQGLSPMAVVEGGLVHSRDPRRLARLVDVWAGGIVLAGLAYGVLALLIPDATGQALFGATWLDARDVLPALALAAAASGPTVASHLGLRTLGAAKPAVRARVATILPILGVPIVTMAIGGLAGAAYGFALGSLLGSGITRIVFGMTDREAMARDDRSRDKSTVSVL